MDNDEAWVTALAGLPTRDAEREVRELERRLRLRDPAAVTRSLTYLEVDPYYFRSGYARQRLARKLAQLDLGAREQARARSIVLSWVDGTAHGGRIGSGRLAYAVADNALRRELRNRLRAADRDVARRALHMLVNVKHPGYSPADLQRAREIVLADAATFQWVLPRDFKIIQQLWNPEWEAELRELARVHGPARAAAKQILRSVDFRRTQKGGRPGP